MFSLLQRSAVISFVLWHAFAVGVYALPSSATDAVNVWIRRELKPVIRPYILLTSQWQQWNLFSPDPLRRVSAYDIQHETRAAWETVETISWETVSSSRRAPILKMLRRLEEQDTNAALRERFLLLACHDNALPAGAKIRLQRRYYVIPKHERPIPLAWWKSFFPTERRDVLASVSCPASDA